MTTSNKRLKLAHGRHPNSLANLVTGRAKLAENRRKGENANPEGYSVTARLKRLLQEHSDFIPPRANPNDLVYRDQIARTMVKEAACGNAPILKELLDRTDGKLTGDQPPARNINIVFVIGKGYRDRELTNGNRDEAES